ncbi:MAG: CehA/McbA family metallohydrolase [Bacteroidota bacterium]
MKTRVAFFVAVACFFPVSSSLPSLLAQSPQEPGQRPPKDVLTSQSYFLPQYQPEELGKLEYPSIAADARGVLYLSYDYTGPDGKEGIYLTSVLNAKTNPTIMDTSSVTGRPSLRFAEDLVWTEPVRVSSGTGEEYASRIAVDGNGTAWVVWSARRNGDWEIYARTFKEGKLGEEMRLTTNEAYDFRPQILAGSGSRVWVVWERGSKELGMQIVAKYFEGESWSEELMIEDREGYAYRPSLVESPDGSIWFGWDHTHGANADVYIRQFKNGALRSPVRVTHHPAMDSKASLAWHDGKLWVAWATNRRGIDDWGIIRYTMIRAFDGQTWYEPLEGMPGVDLTSQSETQSFEFPTITFDRFGRLYLFTRHDHVFDATVYEGGTWHPNWDLDEPSWGLRGLYVQSVWVSDRELWMARRDRKSITLQKLERIGSSHKPLRLRKVGKTTFAPALKQVEAKGDRGPTSNGRYTVYYGDIHVHTAYSDGSGSFDDVFTLYRHVYQRDFIAITDHDALRSGDNHFSPGEWAYLKALNEIYNKPGQFVTLNGYEWTHSTWSGRQDSANRIGHKNVYFRGGEESPFFSHKGQQAHDPESLFKTLHDANAIAFPHHPAWGGMTWEDHDPEIQTNYEIISIHGANEYMGNMPIPHRGGMPGTFAQDGLARGAVLGFVGGTDSHGLYYHAHEGWREDPYKGGLTAVLLESSLTRENVWDALKNRRNYATAGEKLYLEFSINDAPMGSEIRATSRPVISFEARSDKLLYATIIRDNKERFISGPVDMRMARYTGVIDDTIEPGRHYYYLRVVCKDGTLAWSSPIWVDYRP